jgi:hypothetical protein
VWYYRLLLWQSAPESKRIPISSGFSREAQVRKVSFRGSARGALCLLAFGMIACSTLSIRRDPVGRTLDSFMGVHFGEQLDEVANRYPSGALETSPYGARAYKLQNVSSGPVDYRDVIYEFGEKTGMQVAIAHFTPSSTAEAYQQLQSTLGPPTSTGGTNSSDISTVEADWELSNGASVLFSGPLRRLALIGPSGQGLKQDIHLRDLQSSEG